MTSTATSPRSPSVPSRGGPELVAFDTITRQWSAVLTSYLEDGTPVETPVNVARSGQRAFFATFASVLKSRALRRDTPVEVAPCTAVGMAAGAAIPAHVRLLAGREAERVARLLNRAYPLTHRVTRLIHRVTLQKTLYFELVPDEL